MQVSIDSNFATSRRSDLYHDMLVAVVGDLTVTNITPDSATFTARIDNALRCTTDCQLPILHWILGERGVAVHTAIGISDAQYTATGLTPAVPYITCGRIRTARH